MKKLLLLSICMVVVLAACKKNKEGNPSNLGDIKEATIETSMGNITFEFLPKRAPNTVENFKKLATSGFYNGTTFHRVVPGFVIQGGDPFSKEADRSKHGLGGPGYTIKGEFSAESHVRGIVSMARSGHPDSAGSQFFIVVATNPIIQDRLDGKYAVFGRVKEGMDVVDKIVSAKRDGHDNPLEKIEIKKVTLK